MTASKMLVLDTTVPRDIVDGKLTTEALESYVREGGTVHLADGTAVELLAWLHRAPKAWPKWRERRGDLERFLDPKRPILMGGREALAERGLVCEAPQSTLVRDAQLTLNLRLWRSLRQVEDLADVHAAVEDARAGQVVTLRASGAQDQVKREHTEWRDRFNSFRAAAAKEMLRPDDEDLPALLEDQVAKIGRFIDTKCVSVPPASARMDAMMRVHTLHHLRAVKSTQPYNAAKHDHDAFDMDLLRYLALPAAVCTSDRGVQNDLKAARAWQVAYVVTPSELELPHVRARLLSYDWR